MASKILEAIVAAKFLANDSQVEQLASCVAVGQQANGTYLSVLVAHCQAELGRTRKRATKKQQAGVVDAVHERLYAHVLVGVGNGGDIEQNERNRRATFARTAASTLRYFVSKGGSLRDLDPADITKASLRGEARKVPAGTRTERSVQRFGDGFVRSIERLAKANPDAARSRVEAMQEQLDTLLEAIDKAEKEAAREAAPAPTRRAHRKQASRVVSTRLQRRRVPEAPTAGSPH